MLEESRNTITVPSMFVFRILAYLHRRRRSEIIMINSINFGKIYLLTSQCNMDMMNQQMKNQTDAIIHDYTCRILCVFTSDKYTIHLS